MDLHSPIEELSGVGPQYAQKLKKLEIKTIWDLLFYFPRRYNDFSKIGPIASVGAGEAVTIKAQLIDIVAKTTRRGQPLIEALLSDNSGFIKAVWFGQTYILDSIKKGDLVILAGKVEFGPFGLSLMNPVFEKINKGEELKHVGRIVPVYPETVGLTSKWLRYKIQPLLKFVYNIKDYLPKEIKKRQNLQDLAQAVRAIHFPENQKELTSARERLAFDELFFWTLKLLAAKEAVKREHAPPIPINEKIIKKFLSSLPFELTKSQKITLWEILKDLEKNYPANRLLQGDVGSGKTVVIEAASLCVIKAGFQVALMCPTELLARQHFESISKSFAPFKIKMAFLVGSLKNKEKEKIQEQIKRGEIDFVVGTHALISEKVGFKNLGFAIIDEQHRFGVNQRKALREKSGNIETFPHFLAVTATPIPRTLTLTVYGDLENSIIDEMPPGRKPVVTKFAKTGEKQKIYDFALSEIKKGRQAFVICPLIGQGENDFRQNTELEKYDFSQEEKTVIKETEKLKKIWPKFRIEMLHGKMSDQEKERVMAKFAKGRIDILVSTSVVEVGINIPNASVMIIEGADRFGLAQLHQFRGRVGRGEHESFCFLFSENINEETIEKLKSFCEINDGFKLAEIDLELRGPGEIAGVRQHGLPDFKIASLTDYNLIKRVRAEALFLLKNDPQLDSHPLFKKYLLRYNVRGD